MISEKIRDKIFEKIKKGEKIECVFWGNASHGVDYYLILDGERYYRPPINQKEFLSMLESRCFLNIRIDDDGSIVDVVIYPVVASYLPFDFYFLTKEEATFLLANLEFDLPIEFMSEVYKKRKLCKDEIRLISDGYPIYGRGATYEGEDETSR